jgi:hypothetical protein
MKEQTYQERWGEEILDEPELDGAVGVLHDTQDHYRSKALG